MNRLVVEQKVESLRRCIERVASKAPNSAAELAKDYDTQDVVVLNLSRAVQLTVDIASHIISETHAVAPSTMRAGFDVLCELQVITGPVAIRMKNAVGFRNIAVHCYDDLNIDIVFAICTQRLDDFKSFTREVLRYIEAGSEKSNAFCKGDGA